MNLLTKYQDDYILLAGLREYVENGTMLASVNYWIESLQNYCEFDTLKHRADILKANPDFLKNEFLGAFVNEAFPEIEADIPENILETALAIIGEREGNDTLALTKEFLFEYATAIAKSSRENWLALIGLKGAISDEEAVFLQKLRFHLGLEE